VRLVRLPTAMLAREVKGLAWSPERLEARGNGRGWGVDCPRGGSVGSPSGRAVGYGRERGRAIVRGSTCGRTMVRLRKGWAKEKEAIFGVGGQWCRCRSSFV